MKIRLAAALAAAATIALLALACGGDGEPEVRVQRGLGLAGLGQTGTTSEEQAGAAGSSQTGIAAPDSAIARGGGAIGAPALFPFLQQGQNGITVQGYGSATVQADAAVLELYFGSNLPVPLPGQSSGGGTGIEPAAPVPQGQAAPISEADLQPVVDAILAQGVPQTDIEVLPSPKYDPYASSATIRVTVRSLDALGGIIDAATNAAATLQNIALQNTGVIYTVSDCPSLERQAMTAAVEDANERAGVFAGALGVGLGPVIGASHYTYSPFGLSPCDASIGGPVPLGGAPYVQGGSSEVQLVANVAITYAIQ